MFIIIEFYHLIIEIIFNIFYLIVIVIFYRFSFR